MHNPNALAPLNIDPKYNTPEEFMEKLAAWIGSTPDGKPTVDFRHELRISQKWNPFWSSGSVSLDIHMATAPKQTNSGLIVVKRVEVRIGNSSTSRSPAQARVTAMLLAHAADIGLMIEAAAGGYEWIVKNDDGDEEEGEG